MAAKAALSGGVASAIMAAWRQWQSAAAKYQTAAHENGEVIMPKQTSLITNIEICEKENIGEKRHQ